MSFKPGNNSWIDKLGELCRAFRRLFQHLCLHNPGPIRAVLTGESDMLDITFKVQLPEEPTEPNDIVGGKLTVAINGEEQEFDTVKGQTEVDGLVGPQGAAVDLSFVYVDDAGNESVQPSTASVVLEDTVPPANPGTLGVTITGEATPEDPPSDVSDGVDTPDLDGDGDPA